MRVERGRSATECASTSYPPCLLCSTETVNISIYVMSSLGGKAGVSVVQELSGTEAKAVLGKSFLGTWLLHQHGRDERGADQALREVSGRARKASSAKPPSLPFLESSLKSTASGGGRLMLCETFLQPTDSVVQLVGGKRFCIKTLLSKNAERASAKRRFHQLLILPPVLYQGLRM